MNLPFRQMQVIEGRRAGLDDALGELVAGVSLVTGRQGRRRFGFIPASVTPVANDPVQAVLCLDAPLRRFPVFARCRRFTINVLGVPHRSIAEGFRGFAGEAGEAAFQKGCWHELPSGQWGLCNAVALLDCEVTDVAEHESHTIAHAQILSGSSATFADTMIQTRRGLDWVSMGPPSNDIDEWAPIL